MNSRDPTADFIENNSLLYDPVEKPQESFHHMTDIGTYFDKNIQECNAAYESAMEIDESRRQSAGSKNTPDGFTRNNVSNFDIFERSRILMPEENLEPKNSIQLLKYSSPDSPQAIVSHTENHTETSINRPHTRIDGTDNLLISNRVRNLFIGNCFIKMMYGSCNRKLCRFSHDVSNKFN